MGPLSGEGPEGGWRRGTERRVGPARPRLSSPTERCFIPLTKLGRLGFRSAPSGICTFRTESRLLEACSCALCIFSKFFSFSAYFPIVNLVPSYFPFHFSILTTTAFPHSSSQSSPFLCCLVLLCFCFTSFPFSLSLLTTSRISDLSVFAPSFCCHTLSWSFLPTLLALCLYLHFPRRSSAFTSCVPLCSHGYARVFSDAKQITKFILLFSSKNYSSVVLPKCMLLSYTELLTEVLVHPHIFTFCICFLFLCARAPFVFRASSHFSPLFLLWKLVLFPLPNSSWQTQCCFLGCYSISRRELQLFFLFLANLSKNVLLVPREE